MTNEEMLADLKQFIAATISQQMSDYVTKDDLAQFATKDDVANLATKDDVKGAVGELRHEMNDRFDEVLNAIVERFEDHEVRITKLEAAKV